MGRVMAIVSQAQLTMAVIGVSFFRGSITIAKAVSLGLVDVGQNERAFYYPQQQRCVFSMLSSLCKCHVLFGKMRLKQQHLS